LYILVDTTRPLQSLVLINISFIFDFMKAFSCWRQSSSRVISLHALEVVFNRVDAALGIFLFLGREAVVRVKNDYG